jgi:hypothetical protein
LTRTSQDLIFNNIWSIRFQNNNNGFQNGGNNNNGFQNGGNNNNGFQNGNNNNRFSQPIQNNNNNNNNGGGFRATPADARDARGIEV